jgi:hypothetical protein
MTAAQLNEWRVVPRILVTLFGWLFYEVTMWFMSLPNPTASQAAFVSTVAMAGAGFFNFYVNSGGNK